MKRKKRQEELNRLRSNLEQQEARYKSERARNTVLQARLDTLRGRIGSLEEKHLDMQTSTDLQAIKREFAELEGLVYREDEELGGLKGMLRKLRKALHPEKPHS